MQAYAGRALQREHHSKKNTPSNHSQNRTWLLVILGQFTYCDIMYVYIHAYIYVHYVYLQCMYILSLQYFKDQRVESHKQTHIVTVHVQGLGGGNSLVF